LNGEKAHDAVALTRGEIEPLIAIQRLVQHHASKQSAIETSTNCPCPKLALLEHAARMPDTANAPGDAVGQRGVPALLGGFAGAPVMLINPAPAWIIRS